MNPDEATPALEAWCTCGAGALDLAPALRDVMHSITCMLVAVTQPHAMVCPDGDVFYADDEDDAAQFHRDHDAVPVNTDRWPFGDPADFAAADPTPTTGGPVDYEWAEGCVCYFREDAEWGDLLTRPRTGCPVHSCTCLDYSLGNGHSATCLHTTLNAGAPS